MSWDLDGNNAGSDDFLGTRNDRPLIIRTNTKNSDHDEVVRVTAAGQNETGRVGIGTSSPGQRLTLGSGNVLLPTANVGTDGNLYFGGRTDAGETGLRLFGGNVNGTIPGGFIDVRTTSAAEGLRFRVDTAQGGTERMRITSTNVQSFVPFVQVSDARLKTDVTPVRDALARLSCVRGVSYRRIESAPEPAVEPTRELGVLAQDVEQAFPELVTSCGEGDHKAVNYLGLTAALVEAVKELKAQNDELRGRLERVERS